VFLTREWYVDDAPRLQKYATKFGMLAVMANQGASTGTYESAGKSAIWAPGGHLLVQADGVERALLTATLAKSGWQGNLVRMEPEAAASTRPENDVRGVACGCG